MRCLSSAIWKAFRESCGGSGGQRRRKPVRRGTASLYRGDKHRRARARAGGATEIVVMDRHGAGGEYSFNSLIPDLLDHTAVNGRPERGRNTRRSPEEGSDAALFIGMHAMAGTLDGVLPIPCPVNRGRTCASTEGLSERRESTPRFADTGVCSVLLVTGDEAVRWEAKRLLGPGLTTVAVKQGFWAATARGRFPGPRPADDRSRSAAGACGQQSRRPLRPRSSLRHPGRVPRRRTRRSCSRASRVDRPARAPSCPPPTIRGQRGSVRFSRTPESSALLHRPGAQQSIRLGL